MSTRIRDLINILQQKTDSAEEQREYNDTSKEELWNDRKKDKNCIFVLSYIAGCAIFIGSSDGFLPFPQVLLQILAAIVVGALFGAVIGLIVITAFHFLKPSLRWSQKLLLLLLIPIILLAFVSR